MKSKTECKTYVFKLCDSFHLVIRFPLYSEENLRLFTHPFVQVNSFVAYEKMRQNKKNSFFCFSCHDIFHTPSKVILFLFLISSLAHNFLIDKTIKIARRLFTITSNSIYGDDDEISFLLHSRQLKFIKKVFFRSLSSFVFGFTRDGNKYINWRRFEFIKVN